MKKDIDWDAYYNGYSPYEREDIPEDSILHINYEEERLEDLDAVQYLGPKTNVTIKQIIYYMHVKKYNAKFLYNNDTIVILLDYSEEVVDKWKNGRILYCNGDKKYSKENDRESLSFIDKKLFCAGSSGETRVYVFWKDAEKNYRFINGILVLSGEPYQVPEDDGFRWVFPLSIISNSYFVMPEKYSFNVDIRRINSRELRECQNQEELNLVDFNSNEKFELSKNKPIYRGVPQEKTSLFQKRELMERNRQVAVNALQIADFKCEFNGEHATFVRRKQNIPYTEAHHLVPLAYSDLFQYSLDIEENIVSLCSTCHNCIHYGKDAEYIIKKLFAERKELLGKAGIVLSEEELLLMYGIST